MGKMVREERVREEWLAPNATMAGSSMEIRGTTKWGKNGTDNCTEDVEQWAERPRRERESRGSKNETGDTTSEKV